jgi:GNAT superfamily N-acetyltransferase
MPGRATAIGFMRALEGACAERVLDCPGGHALLDSRYPRLWDANRVRVEDGVAPDVDRLVAAAEEHLGGLDFRMITALHEEVGGTLAGALAERGYAPSHELLMVLGGEPPAPAPGVAVTEVDCERLEPTRVAAAVELRGDAEVGRQLALRDRLIATAVAVRCFAVLDGDEIAARCQLYRALSVFQVENVYTVPGHRRRGYAAALVSYALREAHSGGARLVFLVADADDWPQGFYRRMGFRDAGLLHRFKRVAGARQD